MRTIAGQASNSGDDEMSAHFYNLSYAIGPDTGPIGYYQFELDKEYLALPDVGGVAGIIESLKAVLANGWQHVHPDVWESGMKDYFEQLLAHLTQ